MKMPKLKAAPMTIPEAATEAPASPQQIEMVSPTGERQSVGQEHAGTLAALGYKAITPEYEAAEAEKKKYGEGVVNELAAGALGLARGASFGLSDLAIKKGEDAGLLPEGVTHGAQKLEEYNPDASLTGELASFAVPGLGAMGAFGKASKAAKSLGIGQKLVSEGGAGLGKIVESLAKHIVGESGGRIAGSAAHMAAETAVYQAAANISEDSLYDRDLTAESVMANTGTAALLGGGLGAVVPVSVMTGKALAEGAINQAEKAFNSAPVQWAKKKGIEAGEKFFDTQRAAQLYSGSMSRPDLFRNSEAGVAYRDSVKNLWDGGAYKGGVVEMDKATGDILQKEAGEMLPQNQMFDRFVTLAKSAGEGIGDILRRADEAAAGKGIGRRATDFRTITEKAMDGAPLPNETTMSAMGWQKTDQEAMESTIAKWRKSSQIPEREAKRITKIGEEIGQDVDAAQTMGDLHDIRMGLDKRIGGENFKKLSNEDVELIKDIRGIVSRKIDTGFNDLAKAGIISEGEQAAWRKLNKRFGDLAEVLGPLDWQAARAESNVNVGGMRWRDLLATATGASMGGAAFGPIGALVGGGVGIANRFLQTDVGLLHRAAIGERLQQLAWAEKLTNVTSKDLFEGVRNFVHGIDASKASQKALSRVDAIEAEALKTRRTPAERRVAQQEWFAKVQAKLISTATDPQGYAAKESKALEAMATVAPDLRDKIVQKQLDVASYLVGVMPKSGFDPLQPGKEKWNPADYEIKKFQGVVQVAQKPLSILTDLKAGTVTRDQTEAVQALYPKIYEKMSTEVQTQINDPKAPKLTYAQRLRLGILFPGVEPTLEPDFIKAISANMAPEDDKKKGGGGIRSTSDLGLADNQMTDAQELSQ